MIHDDSDYERLHALEIGVRMDWAVARLGALTAAFQTVDDEERKRAEAVYFEQFRGDAAPSAADGSEVRDD